MWYNIIFYILALGSTLTAGNTLDLSWQGLTKEKFFRDNNGTVSSQVEKATELNLRGNFFDSFLDCSANLNKLEILDLSQNKLQRFFFVCKEQDNLYKLNVSHNRLPFLNDTALTNRITKLQVLDLSYNLIQVITRQTFQHLENLHVLALNANPIGNNIQHGAFRNLTSLVDLNLRNVSASRFPVDLFAPLVNLRHLNLALNPLEEVPALPAAIQRLDISGTHILQLKEIDISHLRILRMNLMPRLESLNLTELRKLRNLTVLSMENCPKLKELTIQPPGSDILPEINHISIKNCSIDKLGPELQPVMQRTSELDLQDNPWHCDCGIKWIRTLNSTNKYHDKLRCQTPPELMGKRVFEIPDEEFDCDKNNYLTLWLALSILTLILGIGGLVFFAREPIRQWRIHSGRRDTVIYKNITISSNEAEKILDQCDITDHL